MFLHSWHRQREESTRLARKSIMLQKTHSYHFSITFPPPKIKVKIPKLLAKSMQTSNKSSVTNHCHNMDRKKCKVGSFFSNFLGHTPLKGRFKPVAKTKSHLPDNCGFMNILGSEDDEQEEEIRLKIERAANRTSMAEKSPKASLSFSSFLNKLNCIQAIINSSNGRSNNCSIWSTCENDASKVTNTYETSNHAVIGRDRSVRSISNGVGEAHTGSGRQGSSRKLPGVLSQVVIADYRLKSRSLRRMGSRHIVRGNSERGKEEERGGEELCKKRILMGLRCKPLNLTGILRYDEDGILLPDIIP